MPRQSATARPRTAVTALNAGCVVSSSFLPADRNCPSAPNDSAAWAFCSVVSVLRTPSQTKLSLTAAIVVRSRRAGVVVGCETGSSSMVLMDGCSLSFWGKTELKPALSQRERLDCSRFDKAMISAADNGLLRGKPTAWKYGP